MVASGLRDWKPDACSEADQNGNGEIDIDEEVALECDCSVAFDAYAAQAKQCYEAEPSRLQRSQTDKCSGDFFSQECRSYQIATNETYAKKIFKHNLQVHCRLLAEPCSCTGEDHFTGDLLACVDEAQSCSKYDEPYSQACPGQDKCIPAAAKKSAPSLQVFAHRSANTGEVASWTAGLLGCAAAGLCIVLGVAILCVSWSGSTQPRLATSREPLLG